MYAVLTPSSNTQQYRSISYNNAFTRPHAVINKLLYILQVMAKVLILRYAMVMLVAMATGTRGARILMMPADHHSHVNLFANTGRALQKSGHDVFLIANIRHKAAMDRSGLTPLVIDTPSVPFLQEDDIYDKFEDALITNDVFQQYTLASALVTVTGEQMEHVLTSDMFPQLQELQLDLAFVDASGFAQALHILPYKLGIRYVSLTAFHSPWTLGIPSLPSTEPLQLKYMPPDSTFMQRMETLLFYIAGHAVSHIMFNKNEFIAKHIPSSEVATVWDLFNRSEMFFVNLENICLDSPRISAPHYHFIGGVGVEPSRPLPDDLEEYVAGAPHGVIVVTFGSVVKRVPRGILEKMLRALERLPQRVLLRNEDDLPHNIPHNVLIKRWLPQNDLLGHPNVKLFVTHGGQNGQLEALYHGVPMVVMPFASDQWNNGKKVVEKRYGQMLDPRDFTADQLYETIQSVVDSPMYRGNIERCSKIFRAMPDPKETVIRWTNHVLDHGGSHLKPVGMKVPTWQFFMWDIMAAFIVATHVLIYILFKCCRCILGCCRKRPLKNKTD